MREKIKLYLSKLTFTHMRSTLLTFFFCTYLFWGDQSVFATATLVNSIANLQTAVNASAPNDTLLLANGTYTNNTLTIGVSNIVIKAQSNGGVFLNGTNAIQITGTNNTFSGFQFTSGTIASNAITVSGDSNMVSQVNFNGYGATHMIYITGAYNKIVFCNFQNKPAQLISKGGTGDMVQIIPNANKVGYNSIRYCSFQHMPGLGGDFGNECVRIGDGQYSTMNSGTIVEHCYFEDTGLGDSESISVKSRQNVLRFNTMNNNPNAMFSFRNGDNNVAYSNFFINSGGIRCKQANNIYCYNNYFQGAGTNQSSGLPGSGTAPVYLEYFGTGYGNNFNFLHNTFYGCTANVIQKSLTNCTWANNLFVQPIDSNFSGTTSGQSFAGNMYQGNIGLSISNGMQNINPNLSLNNYGCYGLGPMSPARGASVAAYPAMLNLIGIDTLLKDIQGQPRPILRTQRDVGCDQFSADSIANFPLTLNDVGPDYLKPIATGLQHTLGTISNAEVSAYPNPMADRVTFNHLPSGAVLHIVNEKGAVVMQATSDNEGLYELSLGHLPNGTYCYRVTYLQINIGNGKLIKANP